MPTSTPSSSPASALEHAINLRLALLGCPTVARGGDHGLTDLATPLFARYRETNRQLVDPLCPTDHRIQVWLESYLSDIGPAPILPSKTFILDHAGLARALSLPADGDEFTSPLLKSYRIRQGVLHNPVNDRRTTQGVFHIAAGGLPVPDDKLEVPKQAYAKMLEIALRPPKELLRLPFTSGRPDQAECFVSLLLRPLVCPAVPGFTDEKRMEIRFLAPGSLVSNLDFVESIFGNGGDPYLPENDAGLDVDRWTGTTGCVILAPHLTSVPKHIAGLPHWDLATPRERRDGMCWKDENELYNNGSAFKITARDARGVMVTIIADNYYGYCKKEVKTQISFSANLFGTAEEEHAGGALVYPSYDLGADFSAYSDPKYTFSKVIERWSSRFEARPEGYAVDRTYPSVILVPEHSDFDLSTQSISWKSAEGTKSTIKLLAGKHYVRPSGYRIHMEPIPGEKGVWRLVGTVAEPTLCHKPCTVSGGGKSEISKDISYAILPGHVFVADFDKDFDQVDAILKKDTSNRFLDAARNGKDQRPILSNERSLGSVIKLLTPSRREYNDEHNSWVKAIPQHIKELLFVLKRFHKDEWGNDYRKHFSVDTINGRPGNELKLEGRKVVTNYLRVGFEEDGSWRVFGLRYDFHPAAKTQMEDDITASAVAPSDALTEAVIPLPTANRGKTSGALKIVQNCEARLFQRPDDAIHRGYDHQAEADIASPGTFLSNYEPLNAQNAQAFMEDAINYTAYTEPMRKLIKDAGQAGNASPSYFVSSAHPRIVDGKPTKNPRYLQLRPDVANPVATYVGDLATRLHRGIGPEDTLITPVNVVVPGRRNNPPEKGIRPLAVFNPIHFMELPELFMEFISSMTGKSPSTTGAGSEGAMTKGPFNALPPIIDLNAALVSFILTGHDGFVTAAGYVGPKMRVDHDVSMLVPEVFSRMSANERSASSLLADGCLEKIDDFTHEGKSVLASRLGYRITTRFVRVYFGRIFNHPHVVFTDEMLRPELQDMSLFVDGMDNIVSTHKRVAEAYFADKGVELACPPLKALLHIMAHGHYEGKSLSSPEVRALFTCETLLKSDWYTARLGAKQKIDVTLWRRHVAYLEQYLDRPNAADTAAKLSLEDRFRRAKEVLKKVESASHLRSLTCSLGVQPL